MPLNPFPANEQGPRFVDFRKENMSFFYFFNSTQKNITVSVHNRFSITPNSHHECQPMLETYLYFCPPLPKQGKAPLVKSTKKFLFAAFVLITASTAAAASDFDSQKKQGNWLVGAKALLLVPDVSSTVSIGGEARANSDFVPMADVRYFVAPEISLETMWGYTEHKLRAVGTALGDMSLGTTKALPFNLTAQYHPRANSQISPYVGIGLNYTWFVDGDPGDAQNVKYDDNFGTAFNVGVDYFLDERRFFNIDVKKILISTDVRVDAGIAGTAHAAVDFDPLLFNFGFGWVF